MKKHYLFHLLLLAMVTLLGTGNAFAVEIGSMMGKNLQLYKQVENSPVDINFPISGVTIDYKIVAVDGRAWTYTKMTGAEPRADEWAAQLRCWGETFNVALKEQENNLLNRAANGVAYGVSSKPLPTENPFKFSVYQCAPEWNFYESVRMTFDATKANSVNINDKEAPVLTCTHSLKNLTLNLNLAATDNSDNYFFYVEDATNQIQEVSLIDATLTLSLQPSTDYDINVYAIDFSGNQSEPTNIKLTTGEGIPLQPIVEA